MSPTAIFDLDGTLLDTEPLYSAAAQRVCDRFGKQFTLEIKKRVIGGDARRSAEIAIEALDLPLGVDEYLAEREGHLLELVRSAGEIEGASALLARLRAARVPLALATSSYRPICEAKLAGRSFAAAFDAIVCGDDPRLERAKPAPDIYLLAAAELGVDPRDCVAFEDSANGVRSALAAGMRVVAVVDPRFGFDPSGFPELCASVPNLAAVDPDELGLAVGPAISRSTPSRGA